MTGDSTKLLRYDLVADPYSDQEQVFQAIGVSAYIKRLFHGYSSTVLCYGPTGSGKTYTMQGETAGSGVDHLHRGDP